MPPLTALFDSSIKRVMLSDHTMQMSQNKFFFDNSLQTRCFYCLSTSSYFKSYSNKQWLLNYYILDNASPTGIDKLGEISVSLE